MPAKSLRIAWLGPAPGGYAGVRGVAAELLQGLAQRGHRVDCFLPAAEGEGAVQIAGDERIAFGEGNLAFGENVTFVWGTGHWRWNRWYSRGRIAAFASGALSRGVASLRLRREITRRHRREPYDVIYQFSSIETPGVPVGMARTVPLVIHPETHIAGELRWLIRERRLYLRCQPAHVFAAVLALMSLRTLIQRRAIGRARLLICISAVFRDHLVRDYGFPRHRTVVVANPVRTARFEPNTRAPGEPARVLVLGRISTRKGIEDVAALSRLLLARAADVRISVVGGATLWSDYTPLLEDLSPEIAEYAGAAPASAIPGLLADSDILLQASHYEPFGLTVGEALAAGVPVIATTEVGAAEGVDRRVLSTVDPGDVVGMADAIEAMLERLRADPPGLRARARAEAERLFAPEVVSEQVADALERLVSPID